MSNTKIGEIIDRSACAAWSPEADHGSLVALGTKDSGGVTFDQETGGTLEIYDTEKGNFVGSVATSTRFSSLLWVAASTEYPMGLILGGMADGVVHMWNVQALLETTDALVSSVTLEANSSITALAASPLDKHKVCAGSSKGKIGVIDLSSQPYEARDPAPGHPHKSAAVTAVAWNSQVPHIVATGSADGTVSVWDLNAGKAWCEIATGTAVADVHWNPVKGLYLVTASAEDRNPVILLWDLRASTSMPMATLTGHQAKILNTAWCPHDEALFMSCSSDQRTILWDLQTCQPLADLTLDAQGQPEQQQQQQSNPSSLFASKSSNDQHFVRYYVEWSPVKRGVVLTCSLDRRVQIHSVMTLATKSGRPPAWMTPKSFVTTGFGGLLISSLPNRGVSVSCVSEDQALVRRAIKTETDLAYSTPADFCSSKKPSHPWGFLSVVFAENARQDLLAHLKLDATEVAEAAELYCQDLSTSSETSSKTDKPTPPLPPAKSRPMSPKITMLVQKAVMLGNFEAAVNCCFQAGNFADALLLASCGGAELWAKTQERYVARESSKTFLAIAQAVIKQDGLNEWVSTASLDSWKEILAVLATYGQSEAFPTLCSMLGDRLSEDGRKEAATECYICALNLEGAVQYWKEELDQDKISLEDFCLRVYIMQQATPHTPLPEGVTGPFFEYAKSLANQGLLATAAKYSVMGGSASKELNDRLYRSRASPRCLAAMGNVPPEYPFEMMNLVQSNGQYYARDILAQQEHAKAQQALAEQEYAAQQEQYQQQQQQQYNQQQQQAQQQASVATEPVQDHYGQQYSQPTDALPDGWMALQDPASGQTYYANQNTGEVTWDRPQPPAPAPVPVTPQAAMTTTPSKTTALASKYGDGFVSSASHPELASQYGNVGTSNPYGGERTGTALQVLGPGGNKAPVSGTFNFDKVEMTAETMQVKDSFSALTDALKTSAQLNPVEKRQLAEAEKGIAILVKRMARGDLAESTFTKVFSMVGAINNSDLASASSIQTDLANHDWKEHKDWLKGIKVLIQLALKKFT